MLSSAVTGPHDAEYFVVVALAAAHDRLRILMRAYWAHQCDRNEAVMVDFYVDTEFIKSPSGSGTRASSPPRSTFEWT
jgi:hypothetical protein